MRRGPEPGRIIPLDGESITLGRGTKNDIVIDDNDVSREHLLFKQVSGGYELHDTSSTNGTFVNGQPVEGVWILRSHCIIELGDSITLEYRLGDPTQAVAEESELSARQDFFLIVTTDTNKEPVIYPLRGDVINVGRSTSNDIVIVEPELSRQHFRLARSGNGYTIADLGSTNGTIVNGEPVEDEPHRLYNTDLITIGSSINIHVTNVPEKYSSRIKTDQLVERSSITDSTRKRRTSQAEVAGVAPMLKGTPEPTDIGTGVEHKTLEDQVLISYARADWEKVVGPLVNSLYSAGIEAWVDQYLPENSGDWLIATEQSRLECWLLLVVVSPEAMKSDLVKKNWRHFHNREKPIMLMIHEPVERLPIGAKNLSRVQYNPGVPDVAFQQVIAEIKKLRPT